MRRKARDSQRAQLGVERRLLGDSLAAPWRFLAYSSMTRATRGSGRMGVVGELLGGVQMQSCPQPHASSTDSAARFQMDGALPMGHSTREWMRRHAQNWLRASCFPCPRCDLCELNSLVCTAVQWSVRPYCIYLRLTEICTAHGVPAMLWCTHDQRAQATAARVSLFIDHTYSCTSVYSCTAVQ